MVRLNRLGSSLPVYFASVSAALRSGDALDAPVGSTIVDESGTILIATCIEPGAWRTVEDDVVYLLVPSRRSAEPPESAVFCGLRTATESSSYPTSPVGTVASVARGRR